jgi:sterol desaturase/sphingolipid hydroxylase (fatty acid hydroxylase superfamily)
VPFLWRFHAVHHSIEEMDWVASGRLHPLDQAFTQAFTVLPLFLLGYDAGVFAGVAVFVTLLALFQHANVRLRFPVLRWVALAHLRYPFTTAARRPGLGAGFERRDAVDVPVAR